MYPSDACTVHACTVWNTVASRGYKKHTRRFSFLFTPGRETGGKGFLLHQEVGDTAGIAKSNLQFLLPVRATIILIAG